MTTDEIILCGQPEESSPYSGEPWLPAFQGQRYCAMAELLRQAVVAFKNSIPDHEIEVIENTCIMNAWVEAGRPFHFEFTLTSEKGAKARPQNPKAKYAISYRRWQISLREEGAACREVQPYLSDVFKEYSMPQSWGWMDRDRPW